MNDALERVILVDSTDREIGTAAKIAAHQDGLLHRAFSVFGFNQSGEMLLQQRASEKYHSPGLWANMCCGHPRPGEQTKPAALRRTFEELGVRSNLFFSFATVYKSNVGNQLIEHEYVHVFGCIVDQVPTPNPDEASNVRFATIDAIIDEMNSQPDYFASWFRGYFASHLSALKAMADRLPQLL